MSDSLATLHSDFRPVGGGWRLQLLSVGLVLVLWQGMATLGLSFGPLAVGERLLRYAGDGSLFLHAGITLLRVAAAFLVAMAAGTALGILLGARPLFDRLAGPWLIVALNMPALVVIILCYVGLGLTETAALVAVALNKIPTIAVIVREGARAVDRELLEVASVFELSVWRRFRLVYLPQLTPALLAAARAGLAMTWKIVLVVELLGRPNGIGFKLGTLFQFFDVAGLLAYSLFFIGIVLVIEFALLVPFERRLRGMS
jgi:NitT/TauT family transport system permease protein